jgi:ribonuclease HI
MYLSAMKSHINMKFYFENNFKLKFNGKINNSNNNAGTGIVLYKNNIEIWNKSKHLGVKPLYQAKYHGLIIGLNYAIENNITSLTIETDDLSIYNILTNKYPCSKDLNHLNIYTNSLINNFNTIKYNKIHYIFNKRAYELAYKASLL